MASKGRLEKVRMFPSPHDFQHQWLMALDQDGEEYTYLPIAHYDEGLGSPSTVNVNPEHSSFSTYGSSNCHVDSDIEFVNAEITFSLTKQFMADNLTAIRCCLMPVALAFPEEYDAQDPVSTTTVKGALKLQYEGTDNQGYPQWNNNKLTEKFSGSATLGADVPGLTTTQIIEGVSFNPDTYYDAIHYTKIAGMLKKVSSGIKWFRLTRAHPTRKFRISLKSGAKHMNRCTFQGVLLGVPQSSSKYQIPIDADITAAANYVGIECSVRYDERNQDFNTKKV